jgi:hypothetical protein
LHHYGFYHFPQEKLFGPTNQWKWSDFCTYREWVRLETSDWQSKSNFVAYIYIYIYTHTHIKCPMRCNTSILILLQHHDTSVVPRWTFYVCIYIYIYERKIIFVALLMCICCGSDKRTGDWCLVFCFRRWSTVLAAHWAVLRSN